MRKGQGEALSVATIHILGAPELVRGLNLLAEDVRPTAERLAREGAEITVQHTRAAAERHRLRRSGQLIDSIGYDRPEVHSDSVRIEVYPKGKREKYNATNAQVGFVQDKGRSYGKNVRPGTGFFAEGREGSAEEVQAHWAQGWSEFIEQRG